MHCIQTKCLPSNQTGIKSFLEADYAVRGIGLISCYLFYASTLCLWLLDIHIIVTLYILTFVTGNLLACRSQGTYAGIVGSNPAGGMDVCLLWVLFCQVEVSASGCSHVHSTTTESGVSECDHTSSKMRRPWPTSCCATGKKNHLDCTLRAKEVWQILPFNLKT